MEIVKVIKREEIIVGERFRQDYGDIQELAVSLREEGIIQPLAVRDQGDGTYLLAAGGRRMKAIDVAGIKEVPVRVYPKELTDLQLRVIELMENVCRKDMSWIESTRLKKEIHDLQIQIHGKKVSTSPNASGWSQTDTARLIGADRTEVTREIELAKAIDAFPQLKTAKNKSEANKMLAKLKEGVIREELAKRIETRTAEQPSDKLCHELVRRFIVGDFLSVAKQLPDKSVQFCEIDPPYAIDLMDIKKVEGESQYNESTYNEVPKDKYIEFMRAVLTECHRIMASDSWLVLWFAQEPWFEPMYQLLVEVGFSTRRIPGIWYKGDAGQTMAPDIYLANCYEPFFYARKGNAQIIKQGHTNVFNYKAVPSAKKIHPTERPIEMIQELLSIFCEPGSRVVVPFLGSGNTLLACANAGYTAVGTDLSKEYRDAYAIRVFEQTYGKYSSLKGE